MVKLRQRCVHRAKCKVSARWHRGFQRRAGRGVRIRARLRRPAGLPAGESQGMLRGTLRFHCGGSFFVSPSLLFADTENSVFMYSFSHPHPSSLPGPSVRLRPSSVAVLNPGDNPNEEVIVPSCFSEGIKIFKNTLCLCPLHVLQLKYRTH